MRISRKLPNAVPGGAGKGIDALSPSRVIPVSIAAFLGILWAPVGARAASFQDVVGMAPLPADPPIGGLVWTVVVPGVLFLGSFLGTYLLYRRFSRIEGK